MMYNEKLIAIVKVNGRVLRESKGVIYLPFGAEYSIQLKNLNTTKAVVSISIDGDDVLNNKQLIVPSGDTVELEGFLRGNDVSHKFKFLEKTQEISDFRGDDIEDGLIKVTYQFEVDWNKLFPKPDSYVKNVRTNNFSASTKLGSSGDKTIYNSQPINYCDSDIEINTVASAAPANENGITGRGSASNQSFRTGSVGILGEIFTMVLQLKGETKDNQYVQTPITTQSRVQCDMCGRRWKSSFEFCGNCGNSLR